MNATNYTPSAKFHLQDPFLFIPNLPSHVKYNDLVQTFREWNIARIMLSDKDCGIRDSWENSWHKSVTQCAEVEFGTVAEAERFLATQNPHLVQKLHPPFILVFSTKREVDSVALEVSGNPRLVKLLPAAYTNTQLYDLLRPFAPLASARTSTKLGAVVQFWTEKDAQHAEAAVKLAFSQDLKITLQEFDPCSIFCRNLVLDVDSETLRTRFETAGTVVSARVAVRNKTHSRGYGFVSFSKAEEASNAIKTLDGTIWGSKTMFVRYQEQPTAKTSNKKTTQATSKPETSVDIPSARQPEPSFPKASLEPSEESKKEHPIDKSNQETLLSQEDDSLRAALTAVSTQLIQEKADHQREIEEFKNQVETLKKQRTDIDAALKEEKATHGLEIRGLASRLAKSQEHTSGLENFCEIQKGHLKRALDAEKTMKEKAESDHSALLSERRDWQAKVVTAHDHHKAEIEDALSRLKTLEVQRVGLEEKLRIAEEARQTLLNEQGLWRQKLLLAESRCKILELETHRPEWEKERKRREAEKSEEADNRRRREESERKMRELLAEEKRREKEEKEKKEREAAARATREQEERLKSLKKQAEEKRRMDAWKTAADAELERCRLRDTALLVGRSITWTNQRAFDRFLLIMEEFEKTKYSEARPLVFESIPWPVCDVPAGFTVNMVQWQNIETFFAFVKRDRSAEEHKKLVERTHRMFHPDKWHSKRILESVYDPSLRAHLEAAVTVVSQAMTPLWRKTKG